MLTRMNRLWNVLRFRCLRVIIAGVGSLFVSAAALAQQAQAAPQPSLSKLPPVWLGLLVMFLMLVLVISVSLMPSKRGHQD
jgi:hypothetical protein